MAAATVLLEIATGAGPAFASADSGVGYKYNRADSQTDTTPIPIPTATGTNYSWTKSIVLFVVSTGTTSISNRRIQLSAAESGGLGIFFSGASAYAQAASGTMPASAGTNGPATPATYTRATSGLTVYDNTNTVATSVTGRNGWYCTTVLGVDSSAPGAGSAVALPDVKLVYDEA